MENTADILFENDTPEWFLALGDRWIGPLMAVDVYQKILAQEITWAHYVWRSGQKEWNRICDTPAFQAAVPQVPEKKVQSAAKEAAAPVIRQAQRKAPPPSPRKAEAPSAPAIEPEEKCWFLFYNESQYGPFAPSEISRFIKVGKIHGGVHGWKDGLKDWETLDEIEEFAEALRVAKKTKAPPPPAKTASSGKASAQARAEKRVAPRRPLVAKILMTDDNTVHVGVCRDISIGGMQVLTDRIPGVVGQKVRMNVSAVGQISMVAEGMIVRILEDHRGFSFRFEHLSGEARNAIEAYIRANPV